MSFDLYFHSRAQDKLRSEDLQDYFSNAPLFSAKEEKDEIHFRYHNEETGVYGTFSFLLSQPGIVSTQDKSLVFTLNYNRPITFPLETFPLVESFCYEFDLLVEDVQEDTIQPALAEELVRSWRAHNNRAVQVLAASGTTLSYLPEDQTLQWWRYTRVKNQIELALTEDLFVPEITIVESPQKELFTSIVIVEGVAQLMPVCDYVCLAQEVPPAESNRTPKTAFIRYDELVDSISSCLDKYEVLGQVVNFISAENASSAVRIIRNLDIKPIDLSTYTRIALDSFHNVKLELNTAN